MFRQVAAPAFCNNVAEGALTVDVYNTGAKKPVCGSNVTQDQIDLAVSSGLAKFAPGQAASPPN